MYLMGRLPIVRSQVFFLWTGDAGKEVLAFESPHTNQDVEPKKTATAVTGGAHPKKVVVTAPTYHHWLATLRAASPSPLHTLGIVLALFTHHLTTVGLLTHPNASHTLPGAPWGAFIKGWRLSIRSTDRGSPCGLTFMSGPGKDGGVRIRDGAKAP